MSDPLSPPSSSPSSSNQDESQPSSSFEWPNTPPLRGRQPGIEAAIREIYALVYGGPETATAMGLSNGEVERIGNDLFVILSKHCISRGEVSPVWTGDDLIEINRNVINERNDALARVRELEAKLGWV